MAFWKKNKRYSLALKAALLTLLPYLCCLVYCAGSGHSIGDVYLPASEWNDELFYYKQVEGILSYGYPYGYYGFNESHALSLSFAAWSPVLFFPWIAWGALFGWNLTAPIWCNIFLMMFAMFGFTILVKPTWKQVGILTILFCLFKPFARYMLCGMPEIICISMMIWFYAMAIRYLKKPSTGGILRLFVMATVMTWMRPYFLLMLFLPIAIVIKRKKAAGLVISGIVLGADLLGYVLIKHYLAADYFTPLFYTDAFTTFLDQGIGAGIHHFFGKLYWMGKEMTGYCKEALHTGLPHGAYYCIFLLLMVVLAGYGLGFLMRIRRNGRTVVGQSASEKNSATTKEKASSEDIVAQTKEQMGIKDAKADEKETLKDAKKKAQMVVDLSALHLAFCFVGMFFAILLMYKITEGSRHLLTFMGTGIFMVSLMKTKTFKKATLVAAACIYFFVMKGTDPFYYDVPYGQEELVASMNSCQSILQTVMVLNEEKVPSFENVIIWVLTDEVEGEAKYLKWQKLYAVPKGFGINCCQGDFVREHLKDLSSKYLATIKNGAIAKACEDAEYPLLYEDDEIVIYERKD